MHYPHPIKGNTHLSFSYFQVIMKFPDIEAKVVLLTLCTLYTLVGGKEYPKWPWDFKFSTTGSVSGYNCVQLSEAVSVQYFWFDNHFCVRQDSNYTNIGMTWSNTGKVATFFFKTKFQFFKGILNIFTYYFFLWREC